MPGKARRVAARQSQLNRRRKKQQRGPSGTPVAPVQVQMDDRPMDEVDVEPEQDEVYAPAPMRPTRAAVQPAPANPPRAARARGERPDAYNYVGSEIRRILAMGGVVVVALVVLGVLL